MPEPNHHTSVSVVVPVLNAARYLPALLEALFAQKPQPPLEVVLVDSLSTDDTCAIAGRHEKVRVIPIPNFSHGRSRNLGAREARGEVIALLSQDALPSNEHWLANLVRPLADPQVAAAYSRQVPYPDANPMEQYFLQTHFPDTPPVRRQKPEQRSLTLQDVFFSNVSAVIRRDQLLRFPFDETLIMSEDQQLSRDLLNAGYAVVYASDSVVRHSHNYTLPIVFRRYFDSVYSLTLVFPRHDMGTSASMGLRYLGREAWHMVRHHPLHLPHYMLYTIMKTAGTVAGHFAPIMPKWMVRKCSLHRYHWKT